MGRIEWVMHPEFGRLQSSLSNSLQMVPYTKSIFSLMQEIMPASKFCVRNYGLYRTLYRAHTKLKLADRSIISTTDLSSHWISSKNCRHLSSSPALYKGRKNQEEKVLLK